MSYSVRFVPATNFAVAEVSGPFTTEEICGLFTALLNERGQLHGMRIFCDVSAADATNVSTGEMLPAVGFIRQRTEAFAGMKWASYAPTLLNFGIARMAGEMSADLPFEYRSFKSRELALNWLAMPLPLRKIHVIDRAAASAAASGK